VRIAQIVSFYAPRIGGVETHVGHLAARLVDEGDQVTVLTYQPGGCLAEEWVGGVRVLRFPLGVNAGIYTVSPALSRYLRSYEADFDLIHAHSYHTLVGHAAVPVRLPFVFTPHYHGTGHTRLRALLHHLYRPVGARLLRAADAVICVSDAERSLLVRDFPAAAGKTVTIPNGTERKPVPLGAGQWTTGEPVVLSVGRLERYKNLDLVIAAVAALPLAAVLVVVGDGPDRARLERYARAAKPPRPVLFTGWIPEPALGQWLVRAGVVVSASDHEAFGMTLADGLAAGARVVASALPAHAELARRAGAYGLVRLADPRDTGQFAAALAQALHEGHIAHGELALPSWADVVVATRELYGRVRARSAGPAGGVHGPVSGEGAALPVRGEAE
jgi:glycosyltransferase involved in cell wall biosynthesis